MLCLGLTCPRFAAKISSPRPAWRGCSSGSSGRLLGCDMAAVLLALLVPLSVTACRTDLDCALNGACTAGACQCDPAFEGAQCERFAFTPGPSAADINSPWAVPDLQTSTWGLGILQ